MRYGVLADIHGNVHALRGALAELERHGVDGHLVAGDLVGYGPDPNGCVELLAGLGAVCVAGNHDLIALGRLSGERCIPLARKSLEWTRAILTRESEAFLSSLPLRATVPGGVVLAHGSLTDVEAYTTTPRAASAQLARLSEEHPGSRVLILGHTHRPWAFTQRSGSVSTVRPVPLAGADAVLLNPGAVGQSRELRARARLLLLDLERGCATFFALPYDLEGCRAALRGAGLSPQSMHLRPSLLGTGRRAARGLAERSRRLARTGRRRR